MEPLVDTTLRPRRVRTRTGCLTCRRRRKKCDQRKPRCVGCERNKITCTWESLPRGGKHGDQRSAKAAAAPYKESNDSDLTLSVRSRMFLEVFKAACSQPRLRTNPELSFQVSKNIQHYVSATVDTLAALSPSYMDGLWTKLVLREAQAHPFILDSVDAITAFHCAHLYPDDAVQYVRMARSSNASALSQFRSSVGHVNGDNAAATLTFTFFQILLCIASPFALGGENSSEIIDGIRDLFIALRGFYHLQPVSCPYITDPIIMNWLKHQPEILLPRPSHNPTILSRLLQLASLIDALEFPLHEKKLCFTALAQLYCFFDNLPISRGDWALFFTWPVMLSEEFLDLISAHHPLALIIVVHWSVPVFQRQNHWLFDKWADRTFYCVAGIVGGDMLYMLDGLHENLDDDSNTGGMNCRMGTRTMLQEASMIPHQCKHPLIERR